MSHIFLTPAAQPTPAVFSFIDHSLMISRILRLKGKEKEEEESKKQKEKAEILNYSNKKQQAKKI